MNRIITMLVALMFIVLSLTSCSNNESMLSTSEQKVSEVSSENKPFVTTSVTEKDSETITEAKIIHKSATSMEELLIGITNAIGSHSEEEYNSYISRRNWTSNKYGYKAVHGAFLKALKSEGLDCDKIYTYEDFTYFSCDGSYEFYLTEHPDLIRFDMGNQVYTFDDETETYQILAIKFFPIKGEYERAINTRVLIDLTDFTTEVDE